MHKLASLSMGKDTSSIQLSNSSDVHNDHNHASNEHPDNGHVNDDNSLLDAMLGPDECRSSRSSRSNASLRTPGSSSSSSLSRRGVSSNVHDNASPSDNITSQIE